MMKKHIVYFQGGAGQEDYQADARQVESLQTILGAQYSIHYPYLPKEKLPDFGRHHQIGHEISVSPDHVILAGHSLGASMLLKYLSENRIKKKITGIFLLATPFWTSDEDWAKPFKLKQDFVEKLDSSVPLFFYHCRDDDEVPFAQFEIYQSKIPWATFRPISTGGHQFINGIATIANDINSL